MPLEATATQVSLMVKHLQRLRIKRSTTEGEDVPLIHPWWSLDKGSVLMAFPCQHLVSNLFSSSAYLVLEWSQPTDTERMDAHCKETACLAGYSKDDNKTQNQLLEESGSGQLQAGWSEEWPRRCPEIQQNHKALHLSTVKQAEQPVWKQEGIRGSFLNRSLGQEVSQTSRSAKGGEAHH